MNWTEEQLAAWLQRGNRVIGSDDPRARGLIHTGNLTQRLPLALDDEPESVLQAKVRRWALSTGWLYYHTHDSRRSDEGFPDTVLVRPGELIIAELKRRDGKLTKEQAQWLSVLSTVVTVEAYTWRPENIPAIEARLRQRGTRGESPC